ncbi:MAG: hypothetical protein ACREAW_03465 [Nitrososphaera sp.]
MKNLFNYSTHSVSAPTVNHTVEINKPASAVFKKLQDANNIKEWAPIATSSYCSEPFLNEGTPFSVKADLKPVEATLVCMRFLLVDPHSFVGGIAFEAFVANSFMMNCESVMACCKIYLDFRLLF